MLGTSPALLPSPNPQSLPVPSPSGLNTHRVLCCAENLRVVKVIYGPERAHRGSSSGCSKGRGRDQAAAEAGLRLGAWSKQEAGLLET